MNVGSGKLIAKLRKEAGYTQQSLANILHVTDKAVSKWERGISIPDPSLLPKLSMLLNEDIEYLLAGDNLYGSITDWKGIIEVDNINYYLFDKPVIYYLISYFLLVGIKDIEIRTNDYEYIKSLNLKKYGINLIKTKNSDKKIMKITGSVFLFGAYLTKHLYASMQKDESVILKIDDRELPIVFLKNGEQKLDVIKKDCIYKNMGRGTIGILLNSEENINEVSKVVEVYQKYHRMKIGDLNEIKRNRGI